MRWEHVCWHLSAAGYQPGIWREADHRPHHPPPLLHQPLSAASEWPSARKKTFWHTEGAQIWLNVLFWLKCVVREEKEGKQEALLHCQYCVTEEKNCKFIAPRGMDHPADHPRDLIACCPCKGMMKSWNSSLLSPVLWEPSVRWVVFPHDNPIKLILTGSCTHLCWQPPLPFLLFCTQFLVKNSCHALCPGYICLFFLARHLCCVLGINCYSWENCTFLVRLTWGNYFCVFHTSSYIAFPSFVPRLNSGAWIVCFCFILL